MRRKISTRTVYLATIVAMLATVGGYALATLPNPLTLSTGSGGQNAGTFAPGNTIFAAAGATVALVQASTGPGSCGAADSTALATIEYIQGSTNSCPTTSEWYEKFTFSATISGTPSDTFNFYVGALADQSFTYTPSTTGAGSVTVFIDMGPASGIPGTVSSISTVITGS